ncbi:sulfate transporter CysZ [Alishewanella maricola]|nr:sulfate transporter CysZ [Alishewanella maricola]
MMFYFFKGLRLLGQKGLKRFVLIPLLINLVLFFMAFYWMWQLLQSFIVHIQQWLPQWLHWLEYLLIPLGVMSLLLSFAYSFTMVANFIAAPFNGLLSEKTASLLSGKAIPEVSLRQFLHDAPRLLAREWQKLCYLLPRATILFILCLLIPVAGPFLWFFISAWFFSLQYLDYPFDNNKVSFTELRRQLRQAPALSLSFGSAVALFSMVPLLNLLVMPAAVCGATVLWCERFAEHYDPALQAPGARSYQKLNKYC